MSEMMRPFLLVLLCCVSLGASSQQNMRQVFTHMPDSLVGYLTENNRLDFIDFMESKMDAKVNNALEGNSKMHKLTELYAELSLNDYSQMQMRLLDTSEPIDSAMQIVCVVRTYGEKVRESTIEFYSMKWRKLNVPDYITLPDGMHTLLLDSEVPMLTIDVMDYLDIPAIEGQKNPSKVSMKLNWDKKTFN